MIDPLPATSVTATETVRLRLPADPAYVVLVRTTAAGLAARLDLTLDELEDLRLAVTEACGVLVAEAVAGADLDCIFTVGDGLGVRISATTRTGETPGRSGFGWTVLSALADDIDATADEDKVVTISFSKSRAR